MESVEIENLVIGAGVIGLATGAELSRRGYEVFVLEGEATIGAGISSRNSEVIHSGIYYPKDSLRLQFSIEGRKLLYAYCDVHQIPHRNCGKLVVATDEAEISALQKIARQAEANGVPGVLMSGREARAIEPALACVAAISVAETGIIDSHSYMEALRGEIEDAGGAVLLGHKVIAGRCLKNGFEVEVATSSGPLMIETRRLVVAAGLWSHDLAARIAGYDFSDLPRLTLAKGSYFSCAGPAAFTRLIYPVPVQGGLGTHLTLDRGGQMRFGPDVEWLETNDPAAIDYRVDPGRAVSFYEQIRRYWPGLRDGALSPAFSGVRPKLSHQGEPAADFLVQGPSAHRIDGLVALFGIESPGLTSSLAIAKNVAAQLDLPALRGILSAATVGRS